MSYINKPTYDGAMRVEALRIENFIAALMHTKAQCRGADTLARNFARYLRGLDLKPELGLNWFWYLPKYLDDAFTAFRLDTTWADLRKAYLAETDCDVPSFTDVHIGGLHRLIVIPALIRVIVDAADGRVTEDRLLLPTQAQQACIDTAWRKFVRVAYGPMLQRVNAERHRANQGIFGKTTLSTFAMAGRVAFEFTRKAGQASMTYVADGSDLTGYRSGSNATATPYAICVAMIEEVATLWQIDKMKAVDDD